MPTSLICPKCAKTLTSNQAIPAGKSVTCPKCKAAFTAPGEDDLPDAVLLDEPEPKSRRSGRRDDEDEDRPQARRKSRPIDEDEGADRPRSRRSREDEDDEEDERPRSHRSRRDDDEDDDRPVRRRKQRLNPLLIILPAAAVALFVILGLGSYFFGGGGTVPQSDMVAWLPEDAPAVAYVDYSAVMKHPGVTWDRGIGDGPFHLYGLDPDQVDAVLHTGTHVNEVQVIRLKSSDGAAIDRALSGRMTRPIRIGGKSGASVPGGVLCKASDRLLVFARRQEYLESRIGKNEGNVILPGELREHLAKVGGAAWAVQAGKHLTAPWGDPVDAIVTTLTVTGDRAEKVRVTTYSWSGAAERAAGDPDGGWGLSLDRNPKVSRDGRRVTLKWSSDDGRLGLREFTHGRW
jgi:hypothetical protein